MRALPSAKTALAAAPQFDTLRTLLERDAYDMVLRAFQLGSRRVQSAGERPDMAARASFRMARRRAPLVALAYRRNLALRLSGSTQGAVRARAQPPAPAWLVEGLRQACAGQLADLRAAVAATGPARAAEVLQPESLAAALWDAATGQWRDAASARNFLRILLPGLRDLLAVACARYRRELARMAQRGNVVALQPRPVQPALAANEQGRDTAVTRLPRTPAHRPTSVDLFCCRQNPQALWFAHNLAEHFARERDLQVHLYLPRGSIFGDVFRMFPTPEDLPPKLALREFQTFGGHPAGDIALAVFGSELPPTYIEHRRRCGSRPWVYRLKPLGVDSQPLPAPDPRCYEVPLPQGFLAAGQVKPRSNLRGMRRRLHGETAIFARYLLGAGRLRAPLPDELTVYADLEHVTDLQPWLSAWRLAGTRLRVLVPGHRFTGILTAFPELARLTGPEIGMGRLTLSRLDLQSIQQGDPLLACCDLVLTDDDSVAVRSLAAGVPLLAPLSPAAHSMAGLGATHAMALACEGEPTDARMVLLDGIVLDWVGRQDLKPAWQDLLVAMPALEELASEIAVSFSRAPHVADTALVMA